MDIRSILESQYDLGNILEVTRIKSGVSNENYKVVTNTGDFIARVCHFEPLNQINAMIPFLEYAASVGYPAPRLMKTKDHRSYFGTASAPVIVTSLVHGNPGIYDAINLEQLDSLGSATAQLHQLQWSPEQTTTTNNMTYILDAYKHIATVNIENNKENERFLSILKEDYSHFCSDPVQHQLNNLPVGLIHNDIIPDNVLFDGNKVTSFIDLEEVGQGVMLFDIARVLNSWCFIGNQPDTDRMASFLKGYHLSRSLTPAELAALPAAMHFISFRNSVFGLKMLHERRINSVSDSQDYAHLTYTRQHQPELVIILSTLF